MSVEAGARWREVQYALDKQGLSVKVMQSYDVFTVGGSISVNAHGIDHQAGSLASTVRSLTIVMADGTVTTVSRNDRPELFRAAIGGYGLFGVIVRAELEVTANEVLARERMIIDYRDLPSLYRQSIADDDSIALFGGRISTAPQSFFREIILYPFRRTAALASSFPALHESGPVKSQRVLFQLTKSRYGGQRLRWAFENTGYQSFGVLGFQEPSSAGG